MPRVPTLDNFSVLPDRLPGVTVQPVTPRVDPGRQLAQQSQSIERAGAVGMAIETDELQRANQLRVDDALNRALEAEMRLTYDSDGGFTSQKGLAALERDSGKPLADEYGEALGKEYEAIGAGLGNDWQRQQFQSSVAKRAAAFRASAMRHESQEFQTYTLSVREGTIANRMDFIGRNYNNIEAIDESITSIRAATYDIARVQGKSAEWAEAEARKMTSNAHKVALGTAIEKNDITFADDYLKKYGEQMDADDLLQARGLITKEMDLRVGVEAATAVMGKVAPRIFTNEIDRAFNIALGTESGHRQFDRNGNPMTSPAGAVGIAQVMPATGPEAAKLAGLPWDENRYRNDAEYNAALGKAYFAEQLKRNEGDLAKAYAAYNAGPGRLKYAIQQAEASAKLAMRDPSRPAQTWIDFLPAETQKYVEKNMREFGAGRGAHRRPTPAEIDAELQADPQLAGNPARLAAARAEAKRQYDAIDATIKQREEEGTANAYRDLLGNGGNFAALPPTVRAMIPPAKLSTVMEFAEKVRKGGDVKNDDATWAQVLSLPPGELAAMTPERFFATYRDRLDAAHMEKGYALIAAANGTATDKHLEIVTTANRVKQAAIKEGLIPAGGKPNDKQAAAFATFERLIDERVRDFEKTDLGGKRKANSDELQRIIDGVLLDRVYVDEWGRDPERAVSILSADEQGAAYVKVGAKEIPITSIPAPQRGLIAGKLQARGLPVTEQAIAELWVAAGSPK